MIKFKRRNTLITRLNIDGVDVYDPSIIEQHIIGHFSALFMDDGSPSADPLEIEALIDVAVSDAQNNFLVSIPEESEIAAEVFGMDANSAPGPDGFSGSFFQTCWEIIKTDVVSAVQTFFRSSYLPTGCNSSTMILIPKKKDVSTVADLRPIVLSNFFFKIISKILASRLSRIASTHISNNQFGFISGRNIHDCIMLSSEGCNSMQRTNRGSNMACKIDINKAFDTIRWEFIMQVLRANGYHEKFVNWIWIIFSSARVSILYNGQLSGYFSCSRGVRQGDPLSPILFGIAEDVLSHLISSCVESRHLSPMGFSRSTNFPTHLFYADDIILFSTATVRNARKIKDILNYYGSISGQVCSQEKSNLYFARGVTTDRRRAIQRVMGFSVGILPMTYLGVPIFVGRPRASYFMPIFDKIVQKFARWKGLQLSIAGRLCLVRSVIQSSIVHSMMVYKWPKSLLHSLDRKCRNFIWTGSIDQQPRCSVSWRRVCAPKEEGGLGIRSFTLMNKSFLMKLAWKMIKGDDWAHRIMRSRYLTTFSYAKQNIANSTVWLGVKQEINPLVVDSYSCINNGANTYFWKDDWLGYILVDKLKIPHYMHDYLHFSVQDYYYDGLWHFSASFVNYFPEVVADILLIPMSEEKDSKYWKHSLKGNVSAALAFSKNCHRYTMVKWGTWIWEPYIPIRRSILCWRILHGRLPTLDTLVRQGMVTPNGCPFCYMDAETIEHIMWSCPRISYVWETFLDWFHKTDLLSCLDIHTFLVLAWNAAFSPQILAFWKAGIISILWKIWDCRNALVFDDLRFEAKSILVFVKAYFKEMDSNFSRLGTIKNTWTDYVIVRSLGIGSRAAPPPHMVEVYWWPPVTHWIKVNTDGSAKGTPGRIAAGGVFRDNFASVRGCFHIKGGSGFAFEAELLAVITAINIAHERGWLHLWVESDSMYVVRLLENRSTDVPWRFLASWKQVLHRLHGFSLIVTHIFREGNHPADIMANDDRQEGWLNAFRDRCDCFVGVSIVCWCWDGFAGGWAISGVRVGVSAVSFFSARVSSTLGADWSDLLDLRDRRVSTVSRRACLRGGSFRRRCATSWSVIFFFRLHGFSWAADFPFSFTSCAWCRAVSGFQFGSFLVGRVFAFSLLVLFAQTNHRNDEFLKDMKRAMMESMLQGVLNKRKKIDVVENSEQETSDDSIENGRSPVVVVKKTRYEKRKEWMVNYKEWVVRLYEDYPTLFTRTTPSVLVKAVEQMNEQQKHESHSSLHELFYMIRNSYI
ncbi:uncharacterized protein LOC131004001 [Salvia miltiorrhiza]|uniref:uncharacterized protein LOC131004001 n=1 Tax=Salvia miltiorrhiza TaxID=226208 RepID=UPI0025ABA62B|nr:uncharacterized protein LOC131004001 [Salvia miltiorrhiza]